MPIVFLSPSTQDWNPYVTGSGSEEYWMNRIVDAMEPYLRSNGIRYRRNDPDTSAGAAIREANSGYYDFYLALHSNAIGNGSAQTSARGIIAFYYPGSAGGQRGAELIAKNLREIYPLPDKVTTRPTTALGEVSRSRFPAVLVEIGYHDNYSDALWLESHVEDVARQLVKALTEYFGIPFIAPMDIPPPLAFALRIYCDNYALVPKFCRSLRNEIRIRYCGSVQRNLIRSCVQH